MQEPARLPRISISLMLLVIVPWAIVIIASLRIGLLPKIPVSEQSDAAEIRSIARALDDYAAMYGEYPPDFSSGDPRQEIDDHLKKIFPGRDADRDVPAGINELGPDNALAFWLGGFYSSNSKCPLTGKIYLGLHPKTNDEVWIEMPTDEVMAEVYDGDSYSFLTSEGIVPVERLNDVDYEDLLSNYADLQGRKNDSLNVLLNRTSLFSFDFARLSKRDAYSPRCGLAPLVYFRADRYATAQFRDRPRWGVAAPYQSVSEDGTTGFMRPAGFQIICAGRDSFYGAGSIAIGGAARHQGHADNFTSFALEPLGAQQLLSTHEQVIRARNLSFIAAIICTLAYPVTFVLERRENGLVTLARITTKQVGSMYCSDQWRQRLDNQRRHRRDRALGRLRSKSKAQV